MPTAAQIIAGEIKERGVLPFARFMELALYCPHCGYYEAEGDKVGKAGDFYTSPSVGGLFGELLAFRFARELARGSGGQKLQILEAGAHSGRLARDILTWLKSNQADLFRELEYVILEPSERRKGWQQETLGDFAGQVSWVSGPEALAASETPPVHTQRIAFCNELLDAMPVHRYGWQAASQRWVEQGVAWGPGGFTWAKLESGLEMELAADRSWQGDPATTAEAFASRLRGALRSAARSGRHCLHPGAGWEEGHRFFSALPDGFILEVSPAAEDWWRAMARAVGAGQLLTLDYGFTADEFLVPERARGTLRTYYRHQSGLDVLARPGEQDITAHVDFSNLRAAGEAEGLATVEFATQTDFLTGIARQMWGQQGPWEVSRVREFLTLTHPEHLGRAFRVLVQGRGD